MKIVAADYLKAIAANADAVGEKAND